MLVVPVHIMGVLVSVVVTPPMPVVAVIILVGIQPASHIERPANRIIGAGVKQALRAQIRNIGHDNPSQRIEGLEP